MEVLLAERTSDEANQEISVVIVDAGMPEKRLIWHRHNCGSQLCKSGIGIPASGSVRYRSSQISPALPSFASYKMSKYILYFLCKPCR